MSEAALLSITGRVQGVGYRAWTLREARRRALRGWVRNRLDGSVEALFIGEADKIADMISLCRKGPMLAQVQDIAATPAPDDNSMDFNERPTS
jgi:acylphosphatase